MRSGMRTMTVANREAMPDIPLMPGGKRVLGHALEFGSGRWAADYRRTGLRATFFPFGQGIRNCIGEGFAWTESLLLLSAIAARWQLRLADGADVHPVVSSTLVPSELPVIVTRRAGRPAGPR